MRAVGICGSDIHYLHQGRIADFVVNAPMVIGHESAGVVTQVRNVSMVVPSMAACLPAYLPSHAVAFTIQQLSVNPASQGAFFFPVLPSAPAQIGEGVTGLAVGDAVALEPGVPCWHCSAAREGRYNLDPNIQFFATPPVHGSLATYVDHPAELCYKLPPGVTLEEGAMCEPLSVGIHACRQAC